MYNTTRKISDKVKKEKDDVSISMRKLQDESIKRSPSALSTPKSYVQKSSAADIYKQRKKSTAQSVKAPKKVASTSYAKNNVSPTKEYLVSSPSSISQLKFNSTRESRKYTVSNTKTRTVAKNATKDISNGTSQPTNVTVNSPVTKRKLYLNDSAKRESADSKNDSESGLTERQRSKTRTLKENEIKVLTPELVDNNAEMLNLSRTLTAQPKVFYVELGDKQCEDSKVSDDEISYEDDFQSYQSDFESYHSENATSEGTTNEFSGEEESMTQDRIEDKKESRDEEKMLDSGNYELRESQRSANKCKPTAMEFITEDSEDGDKRSSLTDEGFQEMSSAGSSMKAVHVDVLDRPLFIDFFKSKENKRKRKICELMQQRAKDILNMVTLHEMSYSLFEMKPIPYDLYMAAFGRSNYSQSAAQTFDDGVAEETQTDDVIVHNKWTQHPVEFSKNLIEAETKDEPTKYETKDEDYLSKLTYLLNTNTNVERNAIDTEKDYSDNTLRIYLEQKNGVGTDGMMPYEKYMSSLRTNEFCTNRLRKFLKKTENKIIHILSLNTGNTVVSEAVKPSTFPSSVGYVSLIPTESREKLNRVIKEYPKITQMVFSETKSNLMMTVHKKTTDAYETEKCIVCLWDISVARSEPVKVLVANDDIVVCRFTGNTDGIFVAALEDCSIQLWDLSERATCPDNVGARQLTEVTNVQSEALTPTECDTEWNLRTTGVGCEPYVRACAYTTSARGEVAGRAAGLALVRCVAPVVQRTGRKVVGQVVALQRVGLLTIWNIIQEKQASCADAGKAYWSKMRLEKTEIISLTGHLNGPKGTGLNTVFNLNAAKRRLTNRKREHVVNKSSSFKSDRPKSSRLKNETAPVERNAKWESGVICNDLKIMEFDNVVSYLVAKNCGEVLCCRRVAGEVKVTGHCVTSDTSSITCLEVSPHGLPYFLAGTDSGTVQLYSMSEDRVLLTLDCRDSPFSDAVDKCQADHKGRFISSTADRSCGRTRTSTAPGTCVRAAWWSRADPRLAHALCADGFVRWWELASDARPHRASEGAVVACARADNACALLTSDGDVRIHRLAAADDDDATYHRHVDTVLTKL